MRLSRTFVTVLAAVVALSSGACGGDDDLDGDATTTSLTVPADVPAEDGGPGDTQPAAGEPGGDAAPPGQPGAEPAPPAAGGPSDPNSPADRAAKSDLRNAFTAARTISTDYQGRFQKNDAGDPIDAEAMAAEESSLQFGPSGSASADVVSVLVRDVSGRNSDIWLVTASSRGGFYCIHGTTDGRVTFGTAGAEADAVAACDDESWPGD